MALSKKLSVSPLPGMKDKLPEEMRLRQQIMEKIRSVFELFGFQPLETPAMESWEVLAKKGAGGLEILKETYNFRDRGGRRVGLIYDFTVPLARLIASAQTIPLPFKRYQIGKVWRYGDIAKGRLREFWQADIDVVGSKAMAADAEIIACAAAVMEALGFKDFVIRLNNRKILSALVRYAGVKENKVLDVFRSIDKLAKIGEAGIERELLAKDLSAQAVRKILEFLRIAGEPKNILEKIEKAVGTEEGVNELREIIFYLNQMEAGENVEIDLSLARGLDYYTGPIFEISVGKGIGSVAGGGRYDELIGLFLGKDVPATGISFGIERIAEVMKERKMLEMAKSAVKAFVAAASEEVKVDALKIVKGLREAGIAAEFDLRGRNLTRQLEYADRLGIPFSVIVGRRELGRGCVRVRDMRQKKEIEIKIWALTSFLKGAG